MKAAVGSIFLVGNCHRSGTGTEEDKLNIPGW